MRLEFIFDKIEPGINILESHLRTKQEDFIYLTLDNIKNDSITINGTSKYVAKRTINKYYKKKLPSLNYGDYLLYKKENRFGLVRYEDMLNRKLIIPNNDFIVLNESTQYFDNAIKDKEIRKYFFEQLEDYQDDFENKTVFSKKIEKIFINVDKIKPSDAPDNYLEFKKPTLNPALIKLDKDNVPIYTLVTRMKSEKINLFTEFQRAGNLWESKYQSRLVESVLIKFPIPSFYFDCSDDDNWLVIDGLQRLSAIKKFTDGDLELQDLEYLKDLEGKTYKQLSENERLSILDYNVRIVKIQKGTPHQVKYSLFERINTGGLQLTSQEIRHALNQVNPSHSERNPALFLKHLSEVKEFKTIWGARKKHRMQDRETILRYVSFKIVHYKKYQPDFKNFLDITMTKIYDVSEYRLKEIENSFISGLQLAYYLFQEKAFHYTSKSGTKTFSNALFETLLFYLSKLDKEKADLRKNKDKFLEDYYDLLKTENFQEAISQQKRESVIYRFEALGKIINNHFLC